jgi:hypothetical protein
LVLGQGQLEVLCAGGPGPPGHRVDKPAPDALAPDARLDPHHPRRLGGRKAILQRHRERIVGVAADRDDVAVPVLDRQQTASMSGQAR